MEDYLCCGVLSQMVFLLVVDGVDEWGRMRGLVCLKSLLERDPRDLSEVQIGLVFVPLFGLRLELVWTLGIGLEDHHLGHYHLHQSYHFQGYPDSFGVDDYYGYWGPLLLQELG